MVVGLPPGEQDELVGDGDHERGEQGLSDAAVGEAILGVAEVDVVAPVKTDAQTSACKVASLQRGR
ncbi:hypothetical protein AB0L65_09905 [Nonomuraea sp. NPDC052116]|uniref:hypothetical protein n=1 Tax=Nonomuraea sp. NPDC052116 TaxID=3155665 RepID=UPI00344381C2